MICLQVTFYYSMIQTIFGPIWNNILCSRIVTEKFQKNITSDYYIRHKAHGLDFTVQHYAGRVSYDVTSFLEKNRNFLPHEVVQLLRSSRNPTVQFLFNCPLTKTGNLYSKSPFGSPINGRKLLTPTSDLKNRGNNKTDGKVYLLQVAISTNITN